jgi:peptide/nickel transport system substrate-binding protein
MHKSWKHAVLLVVVSLGLLAGAGSSAMASVRGNLTSHAPSGALNVTDTAAQWPGLDVATDTQDQADAPFLNAIYGQLFEIGPNNAIIDDEASSYKFLDHNREFAITIRKGLVFSNGDPLTAADVAWSINRDLETTYGNIADGNFPLTSAGATAAGNTVTLHMSLPDTAILAAFIDEAPNWTADQTALSSLGEAAYTQKPIGSGPFTVVSNEASAQLDLAANPKYWQYPSKPKVATLDFTSVSSDLAAISALQSGEDQMALSVSTIPSIKSAPSQGLVVYKPSAIETDFVVLNSLSGPFKQLKARQAVTFATNEAALVNNLYYGEYTVVQSQTAPGQNYYHKTNPYYDAFNLKKAKALVKQLGGLKVSLCTTTNTAVDINQVQALATMWQAAGITVNIQDYSLQQMLNITASGSWDAIDHTWGFNADPAINDPEFFASNGAFTANHLPSLNSELLRGEESSSPTVQATAFQKVANIENQQALAIWLYAKNPFILATKSVKASAGITQDVQSPEWEDIAVS